MFCKILKHHSWESKVEVILCVIVSFSMLCITLWQLPASIVPIRYYLSHDVFVFFQVTTECLLTYSSSSLLYRACSFLSGKIFRIDRWSPIK